MKAGIYPIHTKVDSRFRGNDKRVSDKMRLRIILLFLPISVLTACTNSFGPQNRDGAPNYNVDVSKIPNAVPKPLPRSRYGNPKSYNVYGKQYHVLNSAVNYDQKGIASWYGTKFNGELTSSREPYNLLGMTGASPVLPIPTFVRVTNLENGRYVIVKINDRGPFAPNRILDLSYVAAKKLGYTGQGTALVRVQAINFDHAATPVYASNSSVKTPKIYLQVGAFHLENNALQLKAKAQHYTRDPVNIVYNSNSAHPLYRVQIGPIRTVDESDILYNNLRHRGFDHAVTVIQ